MVPASCDACIVDRVRLLPVRVCALSLPGCSYGSIAQLSDAQSVKIDGRRPTDPMLEHQVPNPKT